MYFDKTSISQLNHKTLIERTASNKINLPHGFSKREKSNEEKKEGEYHRRFNLSNVRPLIYHAPVKNSATDNPVGR